MRMRAGQVATNENVNVNVRMNVTANGVHGREGIRGEAERGT